MLNWVIDFSLRHRFLIILGAVAFAVLGGISLVFLDIDAFPDTTPVQVQINTVAPSLGPEQIEQQITFPIEQVIAGLPRLENLRSISKFGLSQVVVTFQDGTDIYFARQLINERLSTVELPAGIERPRLGPVATGLGEVFHYVVTGERGDLAKLPRGRREQKLTQLRTLHDWVMKPKLRGVRGAAEINSWGGNEKQFQIRIDPNKLFKHGLTFDEVVEAVRKNNRTVGGGNIRRGSETLLIQGVGRTETVEQVGNIKIKAGKKGDSIRVRNVGEVKIGPEIRRAAVTADGKGEVVLGLGFMLMGENSRRVTLGLKERLEEIKGSLPPLESMEPSAPRDGEKPRVETVYDRTELISHVIDTVRKNLFEGGLLVIAILFLFLGSLRAAAIVALAIPLSMLFAFSGMLRFGIAASLLSLGAIDFGMIVDSSVVMVENCVRHIGHGDAQRRSRREVIRDAAVEVRRPTMFGELIIMIVYLPILTLEGIEGKLFRPMALTVIFALAGSMVLSLTLMPVLASLILPRKVEEREPLLMRCVKAGYTPVLALAMRFKPAVIAFAGIILFVAFGLIAPNLGSEFVPQLSEGAVVINIVRLAGTGLDQSIEENTRLEQALLKAFPHEISHVWSRIGTPEVATDPMGIEVCDMFISLKASEQWQKAHTQAELTELIKKELRPFLGPRLSFTQPIKMRIDEMVSGVKADVVVKLYGNDRLSVKEDYDQLKARGREVENVLKEIAGTTDLNLEQIAGQSVLEIKINQKKLDRYDVSAKDVLDLVESVGSKPVSEVLEGQFRFPLVIRLPDELRKSREAIEGLLVSTPTGEQIPLARLADVREIKDSPSTITRESRQRRITITCNVKDRDLGSFLAEAQEKVTDKVGAQNIEWGGQFEHLQSARLRLMIVVPVALALIFGLLYLTYHNLVDALRVFTGVPFAWVGGIFALWVRDMPFSISAGIGFIALSGVAVLDDMILVSYIRQLRDKGLGLEEAVSQAALTRLRPVLMTTLVASLGFVPMALSTGMGAEVQRPLATVVIGGVISAMVMSLLFLRVLYVVFKSPVQKEKKEAAAATASRPVTDTVSV